MTSHFPASSGRERAAGDSLEEGQDVFGGCLGLDVVDRVEHEPAVLVEHPDPLGHLGADLLRRAKGQGFLGVDAPAPEDEPAAKAGLECGGVHACRGALDGVEDVDARVDEIFEKRRHGSAGVEEGFPGGVLVDPVVDLAVERFPERPVEGGGNHGPALASKIGAADGHDVDLVAHGLVVKFQIIQGDGGLERKDLFDVIRALGQHFIPALRIADAFGIGCVEARHHRDVPNPGVRPAAHERFVGGSVEIVGLALDETELLLGVRPDLVPDKLGGIEVFLGPGILADDGVEEIAVLGHARAGGGGEVALGVHEPVAGRVGGVVEELAHQGGGAVKMGVRLPLGVGKAEHRRGRLDGRGVHAQPVGHLQIQVGQHLEGLAHLGRGGGEPQGGAQAAVDGEMNAGDGRAGQVQGNPVRSLVAQGGANALAGGHGLHRAGCWIWGLVLERVLPAGTPPGWQAWRAPRAERGRGGRAAAGITCGGAGGRSGRR